MTVLTISSYVTLGYVGNRSITHALEGVGVEVIAMPTVIFSNHPGNPSYSGFAVNAMELEDFFKEINKAQLNSKIKTILTGYFSDKKQVNIVTSAIKKIKSNLSIVYICDPVIGNERGIFIDKDTAISIQKFLLPLADIITPNQFEMEFLSGIKINSIDHIIKASRIILNMGAKAIVLTSCCIDGKNIIIYCQDKSGAWTFTLPFIDRSTNGAGDLFSALLTYYFNYKKNNLRESVLLAAQVCWLIIKNSKNTGEIQVVKYFKKYLNQNLEITCEKVL